MVTVAVPIDVKEVWQKYHDCSGCSFNAEFKGFLSFSSTSTLSFQFARSSVCLTLSLGSKNQCAEGYTLEILGG